MAELVAIATREKSRAPMQEHPAAEVRLESGVGGDARGRPGPRQVTVVSQEAWAAACRDLGREVPWTLRRGNLLVRGVELADTVGARLRVGDVVLEVSGETDPCAVMDQQQPGLRAALEPEWRGGVSCRVIVPGRIRVGDPVRLDPPGPGA